MSKISLIIEREYLTRVKKKSFLIMTFVAPLLFAAVVIVPVWLSNTMKDDSIKTVAIVDDTHQYNNVFENKNGYVFKTVRTDLEEAHKNFKKDNLFAILHIKDDLLKSKSEMSLYSEKQVGLDLKNILSRQMETYLTEIKKDNYNIDNLDEILASLKTDVKINAVKWGKDGKGRKSSVEIVMIIGIISAFVLYMFIFIYGSQVMRGVIEEKTSRIVEVIVSSVKPFQLMMGKVIGIALVGLTQFLLWVVLSGTILFIVKTAFLPEVGAADNTEMISKISGMDASAVPPSKMASTMETVFQNFESINVVEILTFFLIYFMGGYLLYASLFAAIGSAVDNETDTQQFMLPVTIPMIFAIYVAMSAIENPHGPLTYWCSLIPFTSPVVMMVRLPYDVPLWEKLLSVALLVLTFIGTIWMAAKIYRTGILMYGKKVSYKELFKWLTYRN